MDLTSIEATSVAIRIGQVAAAELANLLTHEEEGGRPIEDWFEPRPLPPVMTREARTARLEEIAGVVERLGGYVCHAGEPVSGERLFRWAVDESLLHRAQWADLPFGQRVAFEQFALVTRAVFVPLKAEQTRILAVGAEPPRQLGLALEDSIYEPEDGFDAIVPGMEKMADVLDRYTPGTAAPPPAAESGEGAPGGPRPTPMSIGETPVRAPQNRGGRPRTRPKS